MDGIQPQAVHPEPGQVVQSAREPGEITDTVAVGVLERLDVQAVDDCLLIPALGHVAPLSPWQPWQNASLACPRASGSRFLRPPGSGTRSAAPPPAIKPVATSVVIPRQWPVWRRSRSSSPTTSARPCAS